MPYKDPARQKAQKRAWYVAHRDEVIARSKQSYLDHPQETKARIAAWVASNPEKRRVSNAKYKASHREQLKDASASHREMARARNAKYIALHPTRVKAQRAKYHAEHPEQARIQVRRRAALKRSLPATLTLTEWEAIKAAYRNRCAYCGEKPQKLTQDHVLPLSKGGGYIKENIVPACLSCNCSKQDNVPDRPVKLVLL